MKQGSPEWHAARLGWFTSSNIYKLMQTGRKVEPFSKTAMTYIYQVAAERTISDKFRSGDGLEMYLERMNITSRAMRWGNDMESLAREEYTNVTGNEVQEIGLIRSSLFSDSPDGVIPYNENNEKGTLEIKCPDPSTHKLYSSFDCAGDLYEVKPEYYIQCQCHIMANFAAWCDFISFDPMQICKIHIVRVYPDYEMQNKILDRLELANEMVEEINTN